MRGAGRGDELTRPYLAFQPHPAHQQHSNHKAHEAARASLPSSSCMCTPVRACVRACAWAVRARARVPGHSGGWQLHWSASLHALVLAASARSCAACLLIARSISASTAAALAVGRDAAVTRSWQVCTPCGSGSVINGYSEQKAHWPKACMGRGARKSCAAWNGRGGGESGGS